MQQKIGKGLDEVYPFSDTGSVDIILRDAQKILSEDVGPKNASQIWGFISKFVMLDHFIKALGAVEVHPGLLVPKKLCELEYLGKGSKVSIFLPKRPDSASANVN